MNLLNVTGVVIMIGSILLYNKEKHDPELFKMISLLGCGMFLLGIC